MMFGGSLMDAGPVRYRGKPMAYNMICWPPSSRAAGVSSRCGFHGRPFRISKIDPTARSAPPLWLSWLGNWNLERGLW